jgi:hypothetical protein
MSSKATASTSMDEASAGISSGGGNRKRSRSTDDRLQSGGGRGGVSSKGRKQVAVAADVDIVLAKCRQLKQAQRTKKRQKEQLPANGGDDGEDEQKSSNEDYFDFDNDEDDKETVDPKKNNNLDAATSSSAASASKIPKDIVEVEELSSTEVIEGIEAIAVNITNQVLSKKGFSMEIPSRSSSNQIYMKECKFSFDR